MLPIIKFEDFEACPWQEALKDVPNKLINYGSAFSGKARELGTESSESVPLIFLSAICEIILNSEETGPVFKPMLVFDSKRSPLPEDIPTETLEALFLFSQTIENHLLRSRIFDIIWVQRASNKVLSAKEAVKSYLICSAEMNYDPYESIPYLQRALNITYELGSAGTELREDVYISFENALKVYTSHDLNGLHHKFFSIMANRKISDQIKLLEIMLGAASIQESNNNFLLMRSFLDLAKLFAKNSGQSQKIKSIMIQSAESYVQEANKSSNPMAKARFLGQGIQAYRSIGGFEPKVEELHKQMIDTQKTIPELLIKSNIPLPDMSEIVKESRNHITGKPILDALLSLAFIVNPLNYEKEKANAIERLQKYPLSNLFGRIYMDSKGKTISQSDSVDFKNITGDGTALNSEMIQSSKLDIHLSLYSSILPALQCLLEEHKIDDIIIDDIIKYNQLVPQGREFFFHRGLKSGFEYDFVSSSLFLIPQLENSLRYIMESEGHITSKLTSTVIQREKDLNDLLEDPFIVEFLGINNAFTLKVLLTEQEGSNLRNRLAHGLAEYNELQGDAAAYLWWLILRFLLIPIVKQQKKEEKESD